MKADLTAPVEAAAQAAFEQGRAEAIAVAPDQESRLQTWEQSNAFVKNQWRQMVLPLVTAAVAAIPEPAGSNGWLESLMNPPAGLD